MADGVAADQPRRVLLKLSGEAFGGGKVGIDTQVIRRIAEEIVPDREKPAEEETAAEPYDGEAAETASEAASTEAGESSEEV